VQVKIINTTNVYCF